MNDASLLLWIVLPAASALLIFLLPKSDRWAKPIVALMGSVASFVLAFLSSGKTTVFNAPWSGFGLDFSLRLYHFSVLIVLAASGFTALIALYSAAFMPGKPHLRQFYGFLLLTLSFVNGAVLANNLILLLFFWEGLLVMVFAMIMAGGEKAAKTAVKALVLDGVADLCLMLGIGLTVYIAKTADMSKISAIPISGLGIPAFFLMMTGAIGKAGSMPFHSWIPDAASDAPMPFMAFVPGAIEKLTGIYLLARISLDLFDFAPGSSASIVMMIVGAITLFCAVAMALIQKDYKRLLAYHAISQVGYMILGVGTALPVGILGGLFHMINNAIFKSGLFLTGGAVEKQTGTTDLHALGGLRKRMPVTFACFLVMALSISGVPLFCGFYSKELIFDGALQAGAIFYIVAAIGAFGTAASFIKLGHAAYFGEPSKVAEKAKEAPLVMLIPMIALSVLCVLFGVANFLPIGILQPILGARTAGESFAGILPHNWLIAGISMAILLLAVINHMYGVKKTGSGLSAVDHIHYAPGLKQIYALAEKRAFDPYYIGMAVVSGLSWILYKIDRAIDWFYEKAVTTVVGLASYAVRKPHNGAHWMYILWALAGAAFIGILLLGVF